MERLQAFQVAARVEGFIEVSEVEDGSALWFRNSQPDVGTNSHKRLCLDGLTNSATIYWQTVEAQFNSRTFRTVSSLQEWLRLHPHEQQIAKPSSDHLSARAIVSEVR
jgi:hypothetical protein